MSSSEQKQSSSIFGCFTCSKGKSSTQKVQPDNTSASNANQQQQQKGSEKKQKQEDKWNQIQQKKNALQTGISRGDKKAMTHFQKPAVQDLQKLKLRKANTLVQNFRFNHLKESENFLEDTAGFYLKDHAKDTKQRQSVKKKSRFFSYKEKEGEEEDEKQNKDEHNQSQTKDVHQQQTVQNEVIQEQGDEEQKDQQ